MKIFHNEYFSLFSNSGKLYISVHRAGYQMQEFHSLLLDMPIIQLNNFTGLKDALNEASGTKVCIGGIKPRVEVLISADEMEASIVLNITAKEFAEKKILISSEIVEALSKAGVVSGLDKLFNKPITVQKKIRVAKGTEPVNGKDAVIKYYDIPDKKPLVEDDGTVNHYELNLIDNVKKGDWLGEKIHPTEGKSGMTVTGKVIPSIRGIDFTLKYDKKTIEEHEEESKTILRAKIDGAVKFEGDRIRVDNHLIIPGDVGYETGNISFEGYVTIKGTVKDGFSVTASNDISIQSNMGLGVVNRIASKEGSIYIKGGIFGKNVSEIIAKKSVFIKYSNACNIIAGEDIHIGFYALDSNLEAKKVILDPKHGKIIGGSIKAVIQVIAGVIGNKSEKKTYISVSGFDREAIKNEIGQLLKKYKAALTEVEKAKKQIENFELSIPGAEYVNNREYKEYIKKYEEILEEIKGLDEYRKRLQHILETKGEGEIEILKAAYPETYIQIKNMHKKIDSIVNGSFYIVDKELHHN